MKIFLSLPSRQPAEASNKIENRQTISLMHIHKHTHKHTHTHTFIQYNHFILVGGLLQLQSEYLKFRTVLFSIYSFISSLNQLLIFIFNLINIQDILAINNVAISKKVLTKSLNIFEELIYCLLHGPFNEIFYMYLEKIYYLYLLI